MLRRRKRKGSVKSPRMIEGENEEELATSPVVEGRGCNHNTEPSTRVGEALVTRMSVLDWSIAIGYW